MKSLAHTILMSGFTLLCLASKANAAGLPAEILGYTANSKGITFRLSSGGCLKKDDISVQVEKGTNSEPIRLTVYRHQFDRCLAFFPYGQSIQFTYAELGIAINQSFRVENSNGILTRMADLSK